MSDHVQTVLGIYEAFGRGDLDAILDRIAPQVRWEHWEDNRAQSGGVPYLQPREGHDGVRAFFAEVAKVGVDDLQVLDALSSERQVVLQVRIATPRFADEELHLWTFGDDGTVVAMRHYVDTAKHIEANREA